MRRKLSANSSGAGSGTRWITPKVFAFAQCRVASAVGRTRTAAIRNVRAEIEKFTSRRPASTRVLFRNGNNRSSTNNSARIATTISGVGRDLISNHCFTCAAGSNCALFAPEPENRDEGVAKPRLRPRRLVAQTRTVLLGFESLLAKAFGVALSARLNP